MTQKKQNTKLLLQFCLFILGIFAVLNGFADDLLKGTTPDATATFFGSGKIYIYLAEFMSGLIAYLYSRKFTSFIGIVVVAFIFTGVASHFLTQS